MRECRRRRFSLKIKMVGEDRTRYSSGFQLFPRNKSRLGLPGRLAVVLRSGAHWFSCTYCSSSLLLSFPRSSLHKKRDHLALSFGVVLRVAEEKERTANRCCVAE